jgi:hypothetical protein
MRLSKASIISSCGTINLSACQAGLPIPQVQIEYSRAAGSILIGRSPRVECLDWKPRP